MAGHKARQILGMPALFFDTPSEWLQLPVIYLSKKKASLLISKKRDITLTSHVQKLLCSVAYQAYEPASYHRIIATNAGWAAGEGCQDTASLVAAAIEQSHAVRHALVVVFCDLRRFFPSMDRDVVLLAEAWYGVPRKVRDLAQHLYRDACVRIDTAHGY